MRWIHNFQLFLFDFDGLLVNTEELHFLAYQKMFQDVGFNLDWSFERYCQSAHYSSDALKNAVYEYFPDLSIKEPSWNILYEKKKRLIAQLFEAGEVHLMPGVQTFLTALKEAKIPSCVVTHSPDLLINIVRKQYPIFDTISHWITREHYEIPKPDPECYQKAIRSFAKPDDAVIGFEDTPRGIWALLGTRATPVLICKTAYPEIPDFLKRGVLHFSSLTDLNTEHELGTSHARELLSQPNGDPSLPK